MDYVYITIVYDSYINKIVIIERTTPNVVIFVLLSELNSPSIGIA